MSHTSESELIKLFQTEIESLGGKAYVASSSADVSNIISDIAARSNSRLAVKQRLGIRDEDKITRELMKRGVSVTELDASSFPIEMLSKTDLAITQCDMVIAQTGTLVIRTARDEERLMSCLARVHVAVVPAGKILKNISDATPYLREHLSNEENCTISLVSGPSRTADIEMKHILGVHGPQEVHVIVIAG